MKQCLTCQTTFEDNQFFCPECGAKLVEVQKEPEGKTEENVKKKTEEIEPEVIIKQEGKAAKIILSVLLVISIGIAGVCFYNWQYYEERYWDQWSSVSDLRSELKELEKLERYSDLGDKYGYASYDFYAEKGVLVLKKGQVRHIKIKANIASGTTYYFRTSSSYLDANWGEWGDEHKIECFFVGEAVGYYTVTFTNDVNDEAFDILLIVEE